MGKARVLWSGLVAVGAIFIAPADALAAAPAPAWAPVAVNGPTNLAPGGTGKIAVYAQNVGGAASSGTVTIEDTLPAGLVTSGTPTSFGNVWSCGPAGAGQTELTCTSAAAIGPGIVTNPVVIPVTVTAAATETLTNVVTVSGGGAAGSAGFEEPVAISPVAAEPGVQVFTAGSYDVDGTPTTQAGSHPYSAVSAIFANTIELSNGDVVPAGDPKTIAVDIPPGFLGNPVAAPTCEEGTKDLECPIASQVGLAQPVIAVFGSRGLPVGVHSIKAPVGYPAKFTFDAADIVKVTAIGRIRSDEDYGATIESPNTAQIKSVYGAFFTLWGAPEDPSHDGQRCVIVEVGGCGPGAPENTAFLTMPSDCAFQAEQSLAGEGPFAVLRFDTWLTPGEFTSAEAGVPAATGCDQLSLPASFALQPTAADAATPSAFDIDLAIPQAGLTDPAGLAAPALKRSVVTFPKGVALNPAAADVLATCSTEQIGLRHPEPPAAVFPAPNHIRFTKESPQCPDASKVGTVEVKTALLDHPLPGTLYLAAQDDNPFHSTLAVYLVVDDAPTGTIVKLPGEMRPDPVTGQLTAIFDDGPQLAFEDLKLHIKGGVNAPLATPDTCGKATTLGEFTPWSAPESGPDTFTEDSFTVTGGPGGGPCPATKAQRPFSPTFAAGTSDSTAGAYTPFEFRVNRGNGEQELKGLEFTLPPGLTGKLAGIETCSGAAIAAAEQVSGRAEQASPSCPAGSRLGTVDSGAGIGDHQVHVGGRLYLAGPYKGAPLSAVAIVPAVAGPYDLGNVVSRAALYVDPVTAQLTAKTDPIPDILDGIPLWLRSIRVNVDRAGFILNPTSCDGMSIAAKMTGAGGEIASSADDTIVASSRNFKVDGCDALAFKPKLSATVSGGTRRNDHPRLRAVVSYPPGAGYANTGYVQVALPHSEFLDQAHIRTVCTRVQFASKACPAGSIYGHAEATTPLLDEPLSGPVYLRSSDNKLPDLVVALRGPDSRPIEVALAGRVDSIHGGIRNTFEVVPDAPVSKFVLTMRGGNRGLLVNSRNLCTGKTPRMTVRIVGQNHKRADQFPPLLNDCKKHSRHKRHSRR